MATRNVTTKTLDDVTPIDVLVAMYEEGDNPQEDSPVNITAVALAVQLTDSDTFKILDLIADKTDVINGQGVEWWFTAHYEDAEKMVEAYKDASKVASKPSPAPAKRVTKKTAAKPVQAAMEPVKAADGTTVTVAVSEDSTERRELDASQGEKIISEDDMRDVVKSLMAKIPAALEITEHESDIEKHGLALDEPEFIPAMTDAAMTAGVSENAWYMMHAAITQTARDWWSKHVSAMIEKYQGEYAIPDVQDLAKPVYDMAPASREETGF